MIKVKKLTDVNLLRKASSVCIGKESKISLRRAYMCGHSIIRTQIFLVELFDIPSATSVHLVRHTVGVNHYVQSMRGRKTNSDTKRHHTMVINAEALIHMAHQRLCYRASAGTRHAVQCIKDEIIKVDPDLYAFMVPECLYLRRCRQPKSCGFWSKFIKEGDGELSA